MHKHERRRSPRYQLRTPILGACWLPDGKQVSCNLIDVSVSGLRLALDVDISPQEIMRGRDYPVIHVRFPGIGDAGNVCCDMLVKRAIQRHGKPELGGTVVIGSQAVTQMIGQLWVKERLDICPHIFPTEEVTL